MEGLIDMCWIENFLGCVVIVKMVLVICVMRFDNSIRIF